MNIKTIKTVAGGLLVFLMMLLSSCSSTTEQAIDLKGNWNFQIDSLDQGIAKKWYSQKLKDSLILPGSMAENGKGNDITLETEWTGSIYDSSFYFRPELKKYRQPGNIHIPFWLTPAKHYVGAAWYQKEVNIPEGWDQKQIRLHLERAHTETTVWVNDQKIGSYNSLVAPHDYNLTDYLAPGKHRITIRVDNSNDKINVGPDSHSVSDHTQGNWNGLIGKISLEAFPNIFIADVQVYPDVAARKATVKITIENASKEAFQGALNMVATSFNSEESDSTEEVNEQVAVAKNESKTISLELPFGEGMLTWDEFDPALYQLQVKLASEEMETEKMVQFGMRNFEIKGNQFLINDNPVFLRGTLNNCEFPLTGYPSTEVADWEKIFKTAKAFGLNHIRFHSWCPPEAAFIAADKVGLYLQPEGPSWPNHGPKIGLGQPIDDYLYEETKRLTKAYGNYASFTMLSAGNEPAGNQVAYLNDFVEFWKERDDRRVYTGMSVGGSWPVVPKAEFQVRGGVRGLNWRNSPPQTTDDFKEQIAQFDVPFVAHEIGQYCVFPNFEEIPKYTGTYKAKNFEMFQQDLEDHHMGDQAGDFLKASGALQVLCYKSEIEKILRTPGYAGFQLLGLQDFPGQGSAIVGVIDAFWEEKGYVTAEEYSRFCNQTVPLARISKFVYTQNENFKAAIKLFHSGKNPLEDAIIDWTITAEDGAVISSGSFDSKTFKNGNDLRVGEIDLPLNEITDPSKLTLEVSVAGTSFANDWNFWVYPDTEVTRSPDIYYTTNFDGKAREVLNQGGKVFLNASGNVVKGKEVAMHFLPVFWNTSWFKMRPPHVTGMLIQEESEAFSKFPTSFHSDFQWATIQNKAQVMNLEDFPVEFRPLVQPIDTWFMNRRLALIFEARVGKGKLLVSSADLGNDETYLPAPRQLFSSLQNYMDSDAFDPKDELDFDVIQDIFETPSRQVFDSYTIDSPDELKPDSEKNKVN